MVSFMTKSIVCDYTDHCFLCGSYRNIEIHHIMGGGNRKLSDYYGLTVPLCRSCHNEPPTGAHFNRETMDYLRSVGQEAFERKYSYEEWMRLFGRSYR